MATARELMARMREKASSGLLGAAETASRAEGLAAQEEAAAAPQDAPVRDWTDEERELIAWVERWEPEPVDEFSTVPVMVLDWLTKRESRDRIVPVRFRVPPARYRYCHFEVTDPVAFKERLLQRIARGPRYAKEWTCAVRYMQEMTPEEWHLTGQDRIPIRLQDMGVYRIPEGS